MRANTWTLELHRLPEDVIARETRVWRAVAAEPFVLDVTALFG